MDNLAAQIAELHRQTQATRYQFLRAEVETCYTTLDFGQTELDSKRREVAASEAREAEKTIAALIKFLPELEDTGQRSEIQAHVEDLLRLLESFKCKLES